MDGHTLLKSRFASNLNMKKLIMILYISKQTLFFLLQKKNMIITIFSLSMEALQVGSAFWSHEWQMTNEYDHIWEWYEKDSKGEWYAT